MGKKKDELNIFDIDFDLDFDLGDFDILTDELGETPEPQARILKPRVDRDEIFHKVMFSNAEAFADQIDLTPGARTFAWVSGSFIFGDVIEALVTRRGVGVKKLYIATLSISQENIDSLKNVMLMMGDELERLVLVMSGYQYTTAPTFTDDVTKLYDGIAQIDAAYGGGDYTAFTCGHRIGDKLYMYGQMWHGHVDTVLDTIIADCQRLRCAPVHMEQNADKGFVAKEIMRKGWKVRTYHEPENKYIKISTFLRKWWPNIIWLEGTSHDYINQIMDYTREAEHDDAPDSASVVCRYYDRRSGVKYVSPVFGG